jgi:hypothetical protein
MEATEWVGPCLGRGGSSHQHGCWWGRRSHGGEALAGSPRAPDAVLPQAGWVEGCRQGVGPWLVEGGGSASTAAMGAEVPPRARGLGTRTVEIFISKPLGR